MPAFESETYKFDNFVCANRRSIISQADTDAVTIITMRLENLPLIGGPGYAVLSKLAPYWVERPVGLQFLDIPYNVRSQRDADALNERVDIALQNVAQ